MPQNRTAWLRTQPVAHRGLHDARRPENSLAACVAGVEAGVALELDLHKLEDGTVVVFHDDDLARMTGVAGSIAARTASSLAPLRLRETQEPIPRLSEVLEQVAGSVPLLLELKGSRPVGQLDDAVARLLVGYRGPVAVQSFHPQSLRWWCQHHPTVLRGQLASSFRRVDIPAYQKILLRRLVFNPWTRPDFVSYELDGLPHWAPSLARRGGLPLLVWTVRSRTALRRALELGDNVIFEHIRPRLTDGDPWAGY